MVSTCLLSHWVCLADPPPSQVPSAVWQDETSGKRLQLQTQKLGSPGVIMDRQVQQQRYNTYENKTRDLDNSLTTAYLYLRSLNGQLPDLQRLSALNAEVWLNWQSVDRVLTDSDRQYKSYQYMKQAAFDLHAMTSYWIDANAVRPVYRGTQKDMDDDRLAIAQGQAKVQNTVDSLTKLDQLKRDLNDELPY